MPIAAKVPLVRTARLEDAPAIAELCGQLGYPSTAGQARRRLEQMAGFPYHALFVAELDGGVVGWAHVHAYPLPELDLHADLGGLVVDEAHRSAGLGKVLLAAAEDWARSKGCAELRVRSNVIRLEAHRFYETNGYENLKSQYTFRKRL
jgi:GNAT superfamily N-acetyltransferase